MKKWWWTDMPNALKPPTELDMIDALVRQSNIAICWYLEYGYPIPQRLVEADYFLNSVQDALRIKFGTHNEDGEEI